MATSLPISISRSPAAPAPSMSSLSDVVSSYRRAQTFLSSSNITTADAFPDYLRQQEEQRSTHDYDDLDEIEDASLTDEAATPRASDIPEPLWDETPHASRVFHPRIETHERTPLLKKSSWHHDVQEAAPDQRRLSIHRRASRTTIASATVSEYYYKGGKSTYKQTLFNAIAILLGIGMLSEPLAFAYAGWIPGTLLIIFYGYITCYTAKILARIITEDPNLRTFADIGYKAFGPKSTVLTGLLFSMELFAVGVVLVTLYGDSLHLIIPSLTSNQYKIIGLVVIIPTVFLPLYILSYASLFGILSTMLIIVCIAIDGLMKTEAPGSLWDPAPTQWIIKDVRTVGVAFGLFMAGFGGHAVMPSLAEDMQNPEEFDGMINWAFGIATAVYGFIGAAGYLMFGDSVNEEISKNILETPGYPAFLNKVTVWMLVIAPLSKFALNTRPLNLTIEIWLGIDNATSQPRLLRPASPTRKSAETLATSVRNTSHPVLMIFERIGLTLMAVLVSILIPEFSTLMAFLGSFSAFMLCVIGPICAKIAIYKKCSFFDGTLLFSSIIFTVWGTVAALSESA
ncbi:hypothetical protein M422DRAFT_29978 [Sphaerobolus stellatus SS14]|uniref:Amino acid transporter transmembrane domain-containing protein n=1 Tax=Sphaerobolus stellatus (strain SS14) TaxID=990650 RepID=A0A0C9VDJ5_SPHS4|nr:hypothetical protein M422DRAFT_29978 [Sphaerobolus stellatus SS14]